MDVLLELMLRRLVELIDAIAFDVEFPAVIDAAQPAFLVAPEIQRDAAVRAEFVDQTDAALAVAERDEVLAEQLDAHRRAVRLGDLRTTGRRGSNTAASHCPSASRAPTRVISSFSFGGSIGDLLLVRAPGIANCGARPRDLVARIADLPALGSGFAQ